MKLLEQEFRKNLRELLSNNLSPSPKTDILTWLSKNLVIPSTNAIPGYYNPHFAPYQAEILKEIVSDETQEVVLLMSSQTGKTQMLTAYLMYSIIHTPSLTKFILPGESLGQNVSADRIQPAIDNCKPVKLLSTPSERRDGKNSIKRKEFLNGATLTLGSTSVPNDLTSTPSRIILVDELSKAIKYPCPTGNIVSLLRQRQETFYDKKLILSSTPLDEDTCLITKEFNDSNQSYWENQCVSCSEYFHPEWTDVAYTDNDPSTAHLVCPCCGFQHSDIHFKKFVKVGRFVSRNPVSNRKGFFVSALSSPFTSLPDMVSAWLSAQNDTTRLQQFINEKLCKTFSLAGEEHSKNLDSRVESWNEKNIPSSCLYCTAGVDVQDDRLEAIILGFGAKNERYWIKRVVIQGSIYSQDTQNLLLHTLQEPLIREDSLQLSLLKVFVDTGYLPNEVEKMCSRFKKYNFQPVKGRATGEAVPIKKTYKGASKSLPINVSSIKATVFRWLTDAPAQEDNHFSIDCDEDFFKQLQSEQPIKKKTGGVEWKKIYQRNEVFDCTVYAVAAHLSLPYKASEVMLGRLKREQAKSTNELNTEESSTSSPQPVLPEPTTPSKPVEKQKSSYSELMIKLGRKPKR